MSTAELTIIDLAEDALSTWDANRDLMPGLKVRVLDRCPCMDCAEPKALDREGD